MQIIIDDSTPIWLLLFITGIIFLGLGLVGSVGQHQMGLTARRLLGILGMVMLVAGGIIGWLFPLLGLLPTNGPTTAINGSPTTTPLALVVPPDTSTAPLTFTTTLDPMTPTTIPSPTTPPSPTVTAEPPTTSMPLEATAESTETSVPSAPIAITRTPLPFPTPTRMLRPSAVTLKQEECFSPADTGPEWVWICTGDFTLELLDGTTNRLFDDLEQTGLAVMLSPNSSMRLYAGYAGYCEPFSQAESNAGMSALVETMLSNGCSGGCSVVIIKELDGQGNIVSEYSRP